DHGWSLLPTDRHPIAGGARVAYLEGVDVFEVELVAPAGGRDVENCHSVQAVAAPQLPVDPRHAHPGDLGVAVGRDAHHGGRVLVGGEGEFRFGPLHGRGGYRAPDGSHSQRRRPEARATGRVTAARTAASL